jgi:sulfite reductase (NADPH) flavoprotein alpha-component
MTDTNSIYSPLSSDQYAHFAALLPSLNSQQASWLAGYFASLSTLTGKVHSEAEREKELTILYGSMTGKAEEIASLAASKAKQNGIKVRLLDMADFSANDLVHAEDLLVVVSTHGKGEPPFPAKGLHDYLFSNRAPKLSNVKYAVLALGDSSYDSFCKVGIEFDQQLEKLGATRLSPILLGDVDVDSTAPTWLEQALPLYNDGTTLNAGPAYSFMKKGLKKNTAVSFVKNSSFVPPPKKKPLPSKSFPFSAPVLEKFNLHGAKSERSTIHLELKADVPGMTYQPGDSAGVIPVNSAELVHEVLIVTGFKDTKKVLYKDQKRSFEKILRDSVELSKVTLDVVKKYLALGQQNALQSLMEDRVKLAEYTAGRDIVDLLSDFPLDGLTPESLLSALRPLQPRFYSIASSPLETPGVLHLTVGVVNYEKAGRARKGTCSSYLSEILLEDEQVPIFIEPNLHFRLPENPSTPIIMMGAGTGIAPFRAFVQHRAHLENPGKSWLFFGNRYRETEFLYENEWEKHLASGALTQLDVAFSRDENEKKYVQHCLLERAAEVFQWLEEGAHLYLCGDMNGFATDVQQTLIQLIATQSQRSLDEAETYLDNLQYAGRFQLDVY